MKSIAQPPTQLPTLSPADFATFAHLWNHFHEVLSGSACEYLNQLGYVLGLDNIALNRMLESVGETRLLAILTLGHLREQRAWDPIAQLAQQPDLAVSITAARALVLIDASSAMPLLAPLIELRDDWPLAAIGTILHEAGPQAVTLPLVNRVARAEGPRKLRLIRLLAYAQGRFAMPMIRAVMRTTSDPEIIAASLHLVRDPRDADIARPFLQSSDWRVRVQAVQALGRTGTVEDWPKLVELLSDRQWWVRYRAAQALFDLHVASLNGLRVILARLTDRFAREMLNQVIAERCTP